VHIVQEYYSAPRLKHSRVAFVVAVDVKPLVRRRQCIVQNYTLRLARTSTSTQSKKRIEQANPEHVALLSSQLYSKWLWLL
jgi:hypothetical protein